MQTQLNLTSHTRKEKMFSWMRANGLTYASIASRIGVTAHGLSLMFTRKSIPTRRYKQLTEVGVPLDILPPARDIPTGPRPKMPEEARNQFPA